MDETKFMVCECGSYCHQAIFRYDKDENTLTVTMHLTTHKNIFKRIWYAIKYVFGYTSNYGAWDEFIFSPENEKQLLQYLQSSKTMDDFINNKR